MLIRCSQRLYCPVLRRRPHCQTGCEQIVELRLYQLSSWYRQELPETYYHLVSPVASRRTRRVVCDRAASGCGNCQPGFNVHFLLRLRRFRRTTPAPGVWLYLMVSAFKQHAIARSRCSLQSQPDSPELDVAVDDRTCSPMAGGDWWRVPRVGESNGRPGTAVACLPSQTTTVYPQPNTFGEPWRNRRTIKLIEMLLPEVVFGHQLGTGYNSSSDSIRANACGGSSQIDLFVRTVDSERSRENLGESQPGSASRFE